MKNKRSKKVYTLRRLFFAFMLLVPIIVIILVLIDRKPIDEKTATVDLLLTGVSKYAESTDILISNEFDKVIITSITNTETISSVSTDTDIEPMTETVSATTSEQTTAKTELLPEQTPATIAEEIEITYINGIIIVNKTYALPPSYNPGGLTKEVESAFNEMKKTAEEQGLNLYISSGYRSYERQKTIFNNNVNTYGRSHAETFSARPGHSEHQTGLAFDLNTINDSFADTAEGKWVAENAHLFGFVVRYPKGKEAITGYKYEPWHLRYLGIDLATELFESEFTLEEYLNITSVYASES